MTYIARSSTGKYHLALGPAATVCSNSGQRRSVYTSRVLPTAKQIETANPEMFCKKCFPNGKPATEES